MPRSTIAAAAAFMFALSLIGAVGACGSNSPASSQKVFTQADDRTTVAANVGDVVVVRLPENMTTGYTWAMTVADGLKLTGSEYEGPAGGGEPAVGAGGTRVLTYTVEKSGRLTINGNYVQSWQKRPKAADTFALIIQAH